MTEPTLWNQALIWPILNLLVFFYKGFLLLRLPGAFGFAIIALTALIRGLLLPITRAQLTSAKKMQNIKPHLDELSRRHKDDKVKLQQAQLKLYQDHGINPASGCLPLLVQIPVFISLYRVFIQVLNTGAGADLVSSINSILYTNALHIETLDLNFFGINLASKPNEWQQLGVWLLLIPIITGALQLVQTRLMTNNKPVSTNLTKGKGKGNSKAEEDPMMTMQKQMGFLMPVMIGFFSLSFPVGLSLYWNTFTLFGIMQQLSVNKQA